MIALVRTPPGPAPSALLGRPAPLRTTTGNDCIIVASCGAPAQGRAATRAQSRPAGAEVDQLLRPSNGRPGCGPPAAPLLTGASDERSRAAKSSVAINRGPLWRLPASWRDARARREPSPERTRRTRRTRKGRPRRGGRSHRLTRIRRKQTQLSGARRGLQEGRLSKRRPPKQPPKPNLP